MHNSFTREFDDTARRALSMWNRDPGSPSYGCFDRTHWGWKAKDFGDATLQYAVRLAIPYVEQHHGAAAGSVLTPWLAAFVTYCRSIQRRDGSFDQCYPHERAPGVVYDLLSAFLAVRESGYLPSSALQADLDGVMSRAVAFAMREDERHGEIANHFAHYAFELLNYGRARGDEKATARGHYYLERVHRLFEHDEGWFFEYQGPDPGYQTRTLRYLTKCAALTNDHTLWDLAARAAEFLEQVLMPDGSIHPMLGTRSTALVYPSGFAKLAAHDSRFAPLASLVQAGWDAGRVPLPSSLDFDNAIRLADDAREAAAVVVPPTPAVEQAPSYVHLAKAGITVWRTANRAVFVASRLGGSVAIYSRAASGAWQLRHEDSGYLVTTGAGRSTKRWLSRFPGSGTIVSSDQSRLVVRARVARSLHEELTPVQLVMLRLLNGTLLRFQLIGDLFRRIVVRRLMDRQEWLGLEVEREFTVGDEEVRITDRVAARGALPADAQLFRCRRVTGTHMASARYYQDTELDAAGMWQEPLAWPESDRLAQTSIPDGRYNQTT